MRIAVGVEAKKFRSTGFWRQIVQKFVSDPGQLGLGFPSYERPEFVEREHSRVGLPNHLCEQIFVPTFRIATVERIPGEDMGVRQVLSSPGRGQLRSMATNFIECMGYEASKIGAGHSVRRIVILILLNLPDVEMRKCC